MLNIKIEKYIQISSEKDTNGYPVVTITQSDGNEFKTLQLREGLMKFLNSSSPTWLYPVGHWLKKNGKFFNKFV